MSDIDSKVEISTKSVTVTTGDLTSVFGLTPKAAAAHVELLHADILRLREQLLRVLDKDGIRPPDEDAEQWAPVLDALDFNEPQSQTGG